MSSKDWKFLLLAGITLSFLSACSHGSNDRGNTAAGSPYSGLWANDHTLDSYRQSHGNMDQFCNTVRANPALFEQEFSLDIKPSGEVSRYAPLMRANEGNPYYAEAPRLGNVSAGGYFGTPQSGAQAYGIFERVAADRLVWTETRSYGRQKSYIRASELEMRSYSVAVLTCLGLQRGNVNPQRFSDQPPFPNQQPQFPIQQPRFPNQAQNPPPPPQQYQPQMMPPPPMSQGNFPPPQQPRYYQNPGPGQNAPGPQQAAPPSEDEAPEIAPRY